MRFRIIIDHEFHQIKKVFQIFINYENVKAVTLSGWCFALPLNTLNVTYLHSRCFHCTRALRLQVSQSFSLHVFQSTSLWVSDVPFLSLQVSESSSHQSPSLPASNFSASSLCLPASKSSSSSLQVFQSPSPGLYVLVFQLTCFSAQVQFFSVQSFSLKCSSFPVSCSPGLPVAQSPIAESVSLLMSRCHSFLVAPQSFSLFVTQSASLLVSHSNSLLVSRHSYLLVF